jgi:hypothetical protein
LVLRVVAQHINKARRKSNQGDPFVTLNTLPPVTFHRAGAMQATKAKAAGRSGATEEVTSTFLATVIDWEIAVDLKGFGVYPECVRRTGCRPDIVLHSASTKKLLLVELTVPCETRLEQQHVFKTANCEDLVGELRRQGFSSRITAVEVGDRGVSCLLDGEIIQHAVVEKQRKSKSSQSHS